MLLRDPLVPLRGLRVDLDSLFGSTHEVSVACAGACHVGLLLSNAIRFLDEHWLDQAIASCFVIWLGINLFLAHHLWL